jgi:hypothetical protein
MQSVSSIIAPIISGFAGPVSARIQQRLLTAFRPVHLEIHNESHNHAAGQESHFKVVVVSPEFSGLFNSFSLIFCPNFFCAVVEHLEVG